MLALLLVGVALPVLPSVQALTARLSPCSPAPDPSHPCDAASLLAYAGREIDTKRDLPDTLLIVLYPIPHVVVHQDATTRINEVASLIQSAAIAKATAIDAATWPMDI